MARGDDPDKIEAPERWTFLNVFPGLKAGDFSSERIQMSSAALIAWRERLGLNRVKAAKALGIARNTLAAYEADKREIPLYIALACAALAYGLPPLQ